MAMTMIEKILANHSGQESVRPGDILDIGLDARIARDFGGANVVKNILDNGLTIHDPAKTLFTFDCNPTGSDQKYAVNQHLCRQFARGNGIKVYDIDSGIGTHIIIDEGIVYPSATAVSTDSHANILGAIGAFGQGMGDMDIAAGWSKGKVWFKVPESVKITLEGIPGDDIAAKDVVLNMLARFGANSLLGYSVEIYGEAAEKMTLDQRITISSMATEMGAIIILFPPSREIIDYCSSRSKTAFSPVYADKDAVYAESFTMDAGAFTQMVARPGAPHDAVPADSVSGLKIDSGFIGSCTNGRMEDMHVAAAILKGRKVAPGVVLKIVPSTDRIWKQCLETGLIDIFKKAGALVSNAGCAGCAAGQVGQNGPGEVTVSAGNRNFPGKQGKGSVYLASPAVVAASAVAGFITTAEKIPARAAEFPAPEKIAAQEPAKPRAQMSEKPEVIEGRARVVRRDNIDTDMIFHNRYLAITDIREMGQYAFDNLSGFEDFARNTSPGDIVITGRNFGSGSSRQQAVDCFISLGVSAIVAESFGAIYERNAINAAFPVVSCSAAGDFAVSDGDRLRIDLLKGEISNLTTGRTVSSTPFSRVQFDIYRKGGIFQL
ncbi:MAG TPA: aconitase/3-isopropylmalate dehydratase large subunit family protein [Bacteroidales bacterium]|nr:aconitase/3-isopropylmalate dehydratase large subunit family protein [Bacteroidales bacterium]HQB87186.1 aconitase/3-isopropylmalate dehydratase large subunit family protein [Bacteroidales bacterium]